MKNKKIIIILFILLYTAIAFVSTYHAISFFTLSNPIWLAVILAIAFEIGQALVLFTILSEKITSKLPWILMCILTVVQVLGNVFSSYKYMILNNQDQIEYFTKSVLFFIQSPNPEYNYVMISYITGAILPIVALLMTSMITKMLNKNSEIIISASDSIPKDSDNISNDKTQDETSKNHSTIIYD